MFEGIKMSKRAKDVWFKLLDGRKTYLDPHEAFGSAFLCGPITGATHTALGLSSQGAEKT